MLTNMANFRPDTQRYEDEEEKEHVPLTLPVSQRQCFNDEAARCAAVILMQSEHLAALHPFVGLLSSSHQTSQLKPVM